METLYLSLCGLTEYEACYASVSNGFAILDICITLLGVAQLGHLVRSMAKKVLRKSPK